MSNVEMKKFPEPASGVSNFASNAKLRFKSIEAAFPIVDPGHRPLGSTVLVQIRKSATKTEGGIVIPEPVTKTEHDNTQTAKLLAVGPLAFKNRDTGQPWPEGDWVTVGDFVRIPKYGGDRWTMEDYGGEEVVFALFNDSDLKAQVTADPRNIRAFI